MILEVNNHAEDSRYQSFPRKLRNFFEIPDVTRRKQRCKKTNAYRGERVHYEIFYAFLSLNGKVLFFIKLLSARKSIRR